MEKIRITKRELLACKRSGFTFIGLDYCELQRVFNACKMKPCYYYSNNKYGWRFDVYKLGSLFITTGYDNIHSAGYELDFYECEEIEELFFKYSCGYNDDIERKRERFAELLLTV